MRGRLIELAGDHAAIDVDGRRIDYPLERIERVQMKGDGVANGAAAGMVVAAGSLCLWTCGSGLTSSDGRPFLISSFLYGSLIGAGVDAMFTGRTTVYPGPGKATAAGTRGRVRLTGSRVEYRGTIADRDAVQLLKKKAQGQKPLGCI